MPGNTTEKPSLADALSKAAKGAESMETPDLTKAQLIAVVQAVVALAVLLGAPPSEGTVTLAIAGISALLVIVLPASDALVRRGRGAHAVEIAKAKRLLKGAPAGLLKESLEEELKRIAEASTDERPDNGTKPPDGTGDEQGEDEAAGETVLRIEPGEGVDVQVAVRKAKKERAKPGGGSS
jgi:hypothetical protein